MRNSTTRLAGGLIVRRVEIETFYGPRTIVRLYRKGKMVQERLIEGHKEGQVS